MKVMKQGAWNGTICEQLLRKWAKLRTRIKIRNQLHYVLSMLVSLQQTKLKSKFGQ
jgi:hypothetical protein